MTKRPKTILAVDPGLRSLGIAVLDGRSRLRHSEVLTTSARESRERRLRTIRRRVTELLALYRPRVVLLEATWTSRNRSLAPVHRVSRLCKSICRARGITIIEVPTATVRRQLVGYGKAGKREMASFIAHLYPELRVYLRQKEKWKERHFLNLFDAVALGVWYQRSPRAHA
jgi:Holliday junction resolvasome RuvABC endonuclease subunit